MTELRPLADDPADPGGALLASARKLEPPSGASQRALVALGLGLAAIPLSAAAAAAPGATATGATAVVAGAAALKVAGVALAVAGCVLGGVLGFAALRDEPAAAPRTPAHATSALVGARPGPDGARAVDPPPPGAPIESRPGEQLRDKSETVAQRPPSAQAVRNDLQAELRRIDEARAAAPDEAVALIQLYRRDFPRGALGYEASLVEIDALERSGRHERAVAKARLLLQRHPTGPATNRLRAIVGAVAPAR